MRSDPIQLWPLGNPNDTPTPRERKLASIKCYEEMYRRRRALAQVPAAARMPFGVTLDVQKIRLARLDGQGWVRIALRMVADLAMLYRRRDRHAASAARTYWSASAAVAPRRRRLPARI